MRARDIIPISQSSCIQSKVSPCNAFKYLSNEGKNSLETHIVLVSIKLLSISFFKSIFGGFGKNKPNILSFSSIIYWFETKIASYFFS